MYRAALRRRRSPARGTADTNAEFSDRRIRGRVRELRGAHGCDAREERGNQNWHAHHRHSGFRVIEARYSFATRAFDSRAVRELVACRRMISRFAMMFLSRTRPRSNHAAAPTANAITTPIPMCRLSV